MPNFYALNPQRFSKLSRETERTMLLGDFKLFPGLAAHINASHESVTKLATYLEQLNAVPTGVTSDAEKLALSWQASQQASTVLKAARKRIEQEARELAEEAGAEAKAWFTSQLPDTATKLRAMDMFERYVGKGELENVSALMADPALASVMATTNRRLIHHNLTQTYQDSVTRTALKKFQPDTVAKADRAVELADLADGYSEAIKIVDYTVSSQQAAAAWESRPTAPVMPEAVAAA